MVILKFDDGTEWDQTTLIDKVKKGKFITEYKKYCLDRISPLGNDKTGTNGVIFVGESKRYKKDKIEDK